MSQWDCSFVASWQTNVKQVTEAENGWAGLIDLLKMNATKQSLEHLDYLVTLLKHVILQAITDQNAGLRRLLDWEKPPEKGRGRNQLLFEGKCILDSFECRTKTSPTSNYCKDVYQCYQFMNLEPGFLLFKELPQSLFHLTFNVFFVIQLGVCC